MMILRHGPRRPDAPIRSIADATMTAAVMAMGAAQITNHHTIEGHATKTRNTRHRTTINHLLLPIPSAAQLRTIAMPRAPKIASLSSRAMARKAHDSHLLTSSHCRRGLVEATTGLREDPAMVPQAASLPMETSLADSVLGQHTHAICSHAARAK
jgi:hypothetical protein